MPASEKILPPKLCSLEMICYLGTKQSLAISDREGISWLGFWWEMKNIFQFDFQMIFFQPYYPEGLYFVVSTCVIPLPVFLSLNTSPPSLSLFHRLDSICQYCYHSSILIILLSVYLLGNNSVVIFKVIWIFHLKVLRMLRKACSYWGCDMSSHITNLYIHLE